MILRGRLFGSRIGPAVDIFLLSDDFKLIFSSQSSIENLIHWYMLA